MLCFCSTSYIQGWNVFKTTQRLKFSIQIYRYIWGHHLKLSLQEIQHCQLVWGGGGVALSECSKIHHPHSRKSSFFSTHFLQLSSKWLFLLQLSCLLCLSSVVDYLVGHFIAPYSGYIPRGSWVISAHKILAGTSHTTLSVGSDPYFAPTTGKLLRGIYCNINLCNFLEAQPFNGREKYIIWKSVLLVIAGNLMIMSSLGKDFSKKLNK